VAGEAAARGGFVVETSIDPALQAAARKATRDALDQYMVRQKLTPPYTQEERKLWGPLEHGAPKQNKVYVGKVEAVDDRAGSIDVRVGVTLGRIDLRHEERFNPKRLPPSEFTREGAALRVRVLTLADSPGAKAELKLELGPEAALVVLEPRTREVRALIGSYEGVAGGLDRSTQARRQPGSAFKPLVYGYALHSRRLTLGSVLHITRSPKDLKKKPPHGVDPSTNCACARRWRSATTPPRKRCSKRSARPTSSISRRRSASNHRWRRRRRWRSGPTRSRRSS
jgi:penicillin-binding protein 1A